MPKEDRLADWVGDMLVNPAEGTLADPAEDKGWACGTADGMAGCPAPDCGGMNRPVVGYNGYTYAHLPEKSWPPPSRDVAMFAILAAFMARSSLLIR